MMLFSEKKNEDNMSSGIYNHMDIMYGSSVETG
jgi:hypothetical protein